MLIQDLTPLGQDTLPLTAAMAHLKVPDGYSEIEGFNARLTSALRASVVMIEAHIGHIVLERSFLLRTDAFDSARSHRVQAVPIQQIEAVRIVQGPQVETLSPEAYQITDQGRSIAPVSGHFPLLKRGQTFEVQLLAGLGTFEALPGALHWALLSLCESLMQGAAFGGGMPPSVAAMLAPYRRLRLSLGVPS